MRRGRSRGFTLIEMLVALAIASILLGVGVPSFAEAIKNSRLNAPWSDLRYALYLARSEATKRSRFVSVCARASDASCGTDWSAGWLVFVEPAKPPAAESPATLEDPDAILRAFEPGSDGLAIFASGSSNRTASGASARAVITYDAEGRADWRNGYFGLCDDRGAKAGRVINVGLTGEVRNGRRGSDGIELDVFDRELACPAVTS